MIKFYSRLHNTDNHFKKQFLSIGLLFFLVLQTGTHVNAQCNNTNASGSVTAPAPGNTVQINACAFAGDYSTINGVTASTSYTVTSNNTPVTDYFTIRQGTPGGPVIAYGASPLTWTALTAGTFYVHVNSSYACATQATCRTTSITNNGSCTPPTITVTPGVSCGGTCVPITASGADSYIWYPYSGLFLDCTAAIPYMGGNATSLYTRPLSNTIYTVTGKINATGCTGTTTATVNYTPGSPRILPNPAYACVGGTPVKLRVTSPGTLQYCSGPVNLAVPDNNPSGVSNSIVVSGTPEDCNPTGVTVVINMAHSRIGDMVFALKAPNGNIINLDYFISGTYGNGASTGFTNTNIAWAALNLLSTGADPYTGTFTADLRIGATAGPTGMQPTSTIWTNLFSSLNGNWTLGMYDGVSFQTGILNSWCMKFTFPCATTGSVNATPAVWTPFAGLYTDAIATQAYFGTPIDSVWVKPTVAGTYTYQATTQGLPLGSPVCTSQPGSVTVIAGTPITITSQPANQNLCTGNTTAVFSVGIAAGSGPVSYQWQLSPDAGTTWYDIGTAAPYSGSNTATLTINPVPVTMNGYLFRVLMNGGSGCSGAISNAALLRINPIPTVSITANPLVIGPGETTTIFSTITPNPAATYTWYYNGAVLPGATADTLLVDINGLGNYQLQVTDVNGCSNLSNIITIAHSFALTLFTYPNPSGGSFQVRYYSEVDNAVQRSLNVYTNRGEKIITRTFTQTIPYQKIDVDVRAYGKGLYWIELRDANGKRLAMNGAVIQ